MRQPRSRSTTPLASRGVARRTRSRAQFVPSELLPVSLLRAAVIGAGRELGRSLVAVVRRFELARTPALRALPAVGATSRRSRDPLAPVRLRGVIEATGQPFVTPGSPKPAVFARTIFLNRAAAGARRTVTDETRGVDFALRLPSGELVELAAADIRLGHAPAPIRRPNLEELARRGGDDRRSLVLGVPARVREAALRPGDKIEVRGVLIREVSPDGQAAFARGTPLITRLTPAPGAQGLWVRKL